MISVANSLPKFYLHFTIGRGLNLNNRAKFFCKKKDSFARCQFFEIKREYVLVVSLRISTVNNTTLIWTVVPYLLIALLLRLDKNALLSIKIRLQNNPRERERLGSDTKNFSLSPHTPYGRVRLARFALVRLLRHALPIYLLILRKNRLFCSLDQNGASRRLGNELTFHPFDNDIRRKNL